MIILKRFYCPNCNKLKSRFELKKELVAVDIYWYSCRWCHRRNIMYTSDMIEKTFKEKKGGEMND